MNFGFWEIALIVGIIIFIFGAKKLPEFGRSIGQTLREFKKANDELQEPLISEENEKDNEKEARKES